MDKINAKYLHKIYLYKLRVCNICGKKFRFIDNNKCKCFNKRSNCIIL